MNARDLVSALGFFAEFFGGHPCFLLYMHALFDFGLKKTSCVWRDLQPADAVVVLVVCLGFCVSCIVKCAALVACLSGVLWSSFSAGIEKRNENSV